MSDFLLREQNGHVLTLTLNRPEKKNALNDSLAWDIVTTVREATHDDSVWIIVIKGSGDSFCAGLDLDPKRDRTSPLTPQETALDDLFWVSYLLLTLRKECDKPVIGGINGVAVGAGFALAMATDIRIIAKSARLMAGYTRIGGSPDGGLSWTLTQAIGYEKAMRFMLENRTAKGEEAVELGIAGECVEDDALATRLEEYCQQLAEWPPITMRSIKRVIGKAVDHRDLEGHLRYEYASTNRTFATEDAKEARKAFFEKRKPVFKGA